MLERQDQCKEFVQKTEIYNNMVNRADYLGQKMSNGYQDLKEQAQNSEIYKETTASMKCFRDICTSAVIESKECYEKFIGLNSKSPTELPDQKKESKEKGRGE